MYLNTEIIVFKTILKQAFKSYCISKIYQINVESLLINQLKFICNQFILYTIYTFLGAMVKNSIYGHSNVWVKSYKSFLRN